MLMTENERTLWIVSELYRPEMTSTGYYLTKIAEGLGADRKVKVICGQPNYSARGTTAPRRETLNNVEIFRAWGTRLNKNFIPNRVINMITLGLSVFSASLRRFRRGDSILVVTTPPLMPFIVAVAALLKGSSYTLLIHDNYPELFLAVTKTRLKGIVAFLGTFANRWLFKHAAKVIVVGRDMRELTLAKSAGLEVPVVVVPNWAELENVRPQPRTQNPLLTGLRLEEKFVLLYAGNMGRPNDIESIIDSAAELRHDDSIHFIFLGDGVKQQMIERRIKSDNLTNVTLLPPIPREEQTIFLNACDVGIVTLVAGMLGVSMPSRTYNLMAAGKPILAICESGSELEKVVEENRIGWCVRPHDPENLAHAIKEIHASKDSLATMGERSRDAALSRYSLESAVRKYDEEVA